MSRTRPVRGLRRSLSWQALRRFYGQADGSVSVAAFMDLPALHEMMHLFVDQTTDTGDFHLPRRCEGMFILALREC